ncbi:hypothetical protein [Pseudomonas asplenii]|nr:hypothetical protein [Pseudomonas fuscovaginae]
MRMRFNDGSWKSIECFPWNSDPLVGRAQVRDTEGSYTAIPVVLSDASGLYGELDGVFAISGFNNAVENTAANGGLVVIQDVGRTDFNDYFAMRLDS